MQLKNVSNVALTRIAIKITCFIFILWAANIVYGIVHESGHAIVVEVLGGHVYDIYVNTWGTDAFTIHSEIPGIDGGVLVQVAGMVVTTLFAFISLFAGYAPLTWFLTLRTSIYALNYDAGTDISDIHRLIGSGSWLISAILVALNLVCVLISLKIAFRETAGDAASSSSSAHAPLSHNN
ncbi:MAG TPA: hypothetical protein VGK13_06005 [Methanocellaceae archaeon]|jgi:hypothetical protein